MYEKGENDYEWIITESSLYDGDVYKRQVHLTGSGYEVMGLVHQKQILP